MWLFEFLINLLFHYIQVVFGTLNSNNFIVHYCKAWIYSTTLQLGEVYGGIASITSIPPVLRFVYTRSTIDTSEITGEVIYYCILD